MYKTYFYISKEKKIQSTTAFWGKVQMEKTFEVEAGEIVLFCTIWGVGKREIWDERGGMQEGENENRDPGSNREKGRGAGSVPSVI